MSSSRLLIPTTPGGLLSPSSGDELTPTEELTVQAIAGGTYFVENEIPTGTINGSNTAFTLAAAPSPTSSLEVFLQGQRQKLTTEWSVSGTTLTMVTAPETGQVLTVNYRRQP